MAKTGMLHRGNIGQIYTVYYQTQHFTFSTLGTETKNLRVNYNNKMMKLLKEKYKDIEFKKTELENRELEHEVHEHSDYEEVIPIFSKE